MIAAGRAFQFAFLLISFGILLVLVRMGMKGKRFTLRKLPVFDAMDQAVGRATEMGRPVMFNMGTYPGQDGNPEAINAYTYLGYVSRLCAKYNSRLIATCFSVPTYVVMRGIIRESLTAEGKPQNYVEDDVMYLSDQAGAWGAAVWGIMERDRIAAHFFFDPMAAVALGVLETAQRVGAVQFGGSAYMWRLSDMSVTTDYLLVGEEIYAGAAYLTKDPPQLAVVVGQDVVKWISIALTIVGAVTYALVSDIVVRLIRM